MKIFPSDIYEFKLINKQSESIERLQRKTEISQSLFSKFTDKSFIGNIDENHFKLISSNIGRGAFCILNGNVNDKSGKVLVEINKPFKIILVILMLLPFIALIIESIKSLNKFDPIMILVCILQVLLIRFFFIGIAYRLLSKQSINKLSDVLDTEWIRKE